MKFVDWHGIETECTHVIDYGDTDQTPETLMSESGLSVPTLTFESGRKFRKIDGTWWQYVSEEELIYEDEEPRWVKIDGVTILMEV